MPTLALASWFLQSHPIREERVHPRRVDMVREVTLNHDDFVGCNENAKPVVSS
jgi:hypothetical protein